MATLVEKCWSRKPERKREGCFCQVNYGRIRKRFCGWWSGIRDTSPTFEFDIRNTGL